ncbi:unnamed protein product [Rhizophagus irregularis]|nr:unnamed protein product [Rhizophagus irregularis]
MSNMGDLVRNPNSAEDFLKFIGYETGSFLQEVTTQLGSFIENGFLKNLFDKGPQATDKAQLLVDMFGECANPNNFSEQAKATNIQPTTLALIFSIALYTSSRSWDYFAARAYRVYGDMGDDTESECPSESDELFASTSSSNVNTTPNPVLETPPILPDVEMTPVDQTVTPETSRKKDKQKARVTDDKQVKNQSTTANPGAQTSARLKPRRGLGNKSATEPEATQILTGFKETDELREQVRDIIVYDIPYTWDVEKILGELTLWGNTIKLSVKRQHKYQTLRVKIVLNSFTLPQFDKFWTTDLGGIPVRWFPASWNLRERKQREKFQAVIHDIPEEMTMATLWNDRKPTAFLTSCGASAFKIIQTSKGKRKLVGYFENWEATLRALDTPQVFLTLGKELKWCQHSVPTLKKKQHKPKAKDTPNKKSGNTGHSSDDNQSKKKDKISSTKHAKNDNQLKNPNSQKKAKKSSKSKGRNNSYNKVLAEILNLLRKLD